MTAAPPRILAASGDGEAFLQSKAHESPVRLLTNQDWVVGGDAARVFAQIGPEDAAQGDKGPRGGLET
jgi:hypothetical protein